MKAVRRTSVFAALIAIFVQLFIPASMAIAASMTNTKVADWRNTWHLHLFNGLHWTDTGMWMKKVDGKVAFCVEHGVDLDMSSSGYNPSTYSDAKKDQLAKIAYYGYYQNPTNRNYAVTQMIIWETLGDSLLTTPNKTYQSEKKTILDKVATHDRKPSFNGKQITLAVGDSITLTVTNGRLAAFAQQTANTANLKITKSGNKLTLTATAQSKESGKVAYAIAKAADVGTSFVYTKGSQQKLVNFKLSNNGEFSLPIKVNLNGNVKAKKVDTNTNKALPGAKLKFEYDGTTKEVTTGTDGYVALNGIKAGTKIKISEVTAPNGYVNKGELKEVTIEPGKTVEVVLGNKEQIGNVTLAKIGREFGSDMFNAYYSLNGAVYGIYTSTGTRVGAITTDGNGKGTLQNLKMFEHMYMDKIKPVDIQKWQNQMTCQVSKSYTRLVQCMLSRVFQRAIVLGFMNENPTKTVGNVKKVKNQVDFWTKEEFEAVIKTFYIEDFYQHFCFFTLWFLFMTGMRIGEATALQWDDIDFEEGTVRINKTLWLRSYTNYSFSTPKTKASNRTIPLDAKTLELLSDWKKAQALECKTDFVLSFNGVPTRRDLVMRIIKRHAALAGVHRIRVHALRHSHASLLISLGENPLVIKERLGHEDIQTTLGTYGHLYPNMNFEAAKRLNGLVEISTAKSDVAQVQNNGVTAGLAPEVAR